MAEPSYDYAIEQLVRTYQRAITEIQRELERMDLSSVSRANSAAALASVSKTLAALNEESAAWVSEHVPKAALDGVASTLYALGTAATLEEAHALAKFNRVNAALVKAAVADTQADLLAVTQNIDRKIRVAVRKVTGEVMRANLAKGINGRRTMNADVLGGLRKELGSALDTGIIDAAGRRWKPQVYVDMLTRTKMMRTQQEAMEAEAIGRGAYYGRISRHGATDACAKYEGTIVKLTPDAPGSYPYIGDLRQGRDIFHPQCRHVVSPLRNPEADSRS